MKMMHHQLGPEGANTVSALALRWAALRGMLASPLIEAEEHQVLRAELVSELAALDQDMAALPARSGAEVAAKIDILQTGLHGAGIEAGLAQSPFENAAWARFWGSLAPTWAGCGPESSVSVRPALSGGAATRPT